MTDDELACVDFSDDAIARRIYGLSFTEIRVWKSQAADIRPRLLMRYNRMLSSYDDYISIFADIHPALTGIC